MSDDDLQALAATLAEIRDRLGALEGRETGAVSSTAAGAGDSYLLQRLAAAEAAASPEATLERYARLRAAVGTDAREDRLERLVTAGVTAAARALGPLLMGPRAPQAAAPAEAPQAAPEHEAA